MGRGLLRLAETYLELSPALTGSAALSYRARTVTIHAVEVDAEGNRAELAACGSPVRGDYYRIPWDQVGASQQSTACSDALA